MSNLRAIAVVIVFMWAVSDVRSAMMTSAQIAVALSPEAVKVLALADVYGDLIRFLSALSCVSWLLVKDEANRKKGR